MIRLVRDVEVFSFARRDARGVERLPIGTSGTLERVRHVYAEGSVYLQIKSIEVVPVLQICSCCCNTTLSLRWGV